MEFKIEFPSMGQYLLATDIVNFKIKSSFDSPYITATLEINDFAKKHYNQIKLGMPVNVYFAEAFSNNSSNHFKNSLRVIGFNKAPGSQTLVNDYLSLNLISAWYFESSAKSGAFLGNVGKIIEEVASSEFNNSFSRIKINNTDDIEKVRYQALEKPQDFIQRILKFGHVQSLPIYLNTTFKNELVLNTITDFMSAPYKATLATVATEQFRTIPSNNKKDIKIKMDSFRFVSNGNNTSSKTTTLFTVDHFKSSREPKRSLTLSNAENGNIQSEKGTPNKTNFLGWDITPEDALAISSKQNFETNIGAFTLVTMIPDFNMDEIYIGSKLHVILPYEPVMSYNGTPTNLGEGDYIVLQVEYIFENQRKSTKVTLAQTVYKN